MIRQAKPIDAQPRSDEEIRRHVMEQLKWDDRVEADNISVEVHSGIVLLSGTVPTYGACKAARESAGTVLGVKSVHSRLGILFPNHTKVPEDSEIRLSAINTFSWSPQIDPSNIEIFVERGVVILEGSVESYAQKVRAGELLSTLLGVQDVKNHLAVAPLHDFLDDAVADDINAALKRDASAGTCGIDVDVTDGVVTLSGQVPDAAAYQTACQIAINTRGVLDVVSKLEVAG